MRWIWEKVKNNICREELQQKVFLFLNTIFWLCAGFAASFLIGALCIPAGGKLVFYALIAAGYAALFIGFLGGCIFLMRNTPE